MRIQPRQQILDIWQSVLSASGAGEVWAWGGPGAGDSISDAAQLLCLLYPATEIDSLAIGNPDRIADDVATALEPLGWPSQIDQALVGLLEEYLERNTAADGEPTFTVADHVSGTESGRPTGAQGGIEAVDAYAISVRLCLAGLRYLWSAQRAAAERRGHMDRVLRLTRSLGARLTAALTGLLRSFVVTTIVPESPAGQSIIRMLNQADRPEKQVLRELSESLERVRTRVRNDVSLGRTHGFDLYDDQLLLECGWTWGVAKDAAPVDLVEAAVAVRAGIAEPRPDLYFTSTALDAIDDLLSPHTRESGLLDESQWRLAEALQIRSDLARRYWSTVARFGSGHWPLEDIPWRTSDGEQSDYASLVVAGILIQDLADRVASHDELPRVAAILDELARHGRITRRPMLDDPAIQLHAPGIAVHLNGTEEVDGGPRLRRRVPDFAAVLLERTLQAAGLATELGTRDQLMRLAGLTMEHLNLRLLQEGPAAGLWEHATGGPGDSGPSWCLSERVTRCLVTAERGIRAPLPSAPASRTLARELLCEAEHLLDRQLLDTETSTARHDLGRMEDLIDRSRDLLTRGSPGTASALALQALHQLDRLAVARSDADRIR
ncbi:SCO2524 family protein [Nocardia sp. NPDC050712]|uniref:SCO2524 family protein n=1 Tax=Nocardia sp. NPDC050712 TaxID=3155518 RepID=UPI0033E236B9